MSGVVPVSVTGFGLGSMLTNVGVWSAVALLLGIIIKTRVPMKKIQTDADAGFRAGLMARIEKLEHALETERADCEAHLSVLRHRMNNMTNAFDALLLLIEMEPTKAAQHVSKIKDMRAKQELTEATEKATLSAGKIAGAGG